MKSVTDMLSPLAKDKQQFTSVQTAWLQFLHYLRDRKGRDINGIRKQEDIEMALEYVEANDENLGAHQDRSRASWFGTFECRNDVLKACREFLEERGLPHS